MIRFLDIRIIEADERLTPERYDVAFVGVPLDPRDQRTFDISFASAARTVITKYDPIAATLHLGGRAFRPTDRHRICEAFPGNTILIDGSSLNAVEILFLCRTFLSQAGTQIGILYAEPENYLPDIGPEGANDTFSFCERFEGSHAIPGFTRELRDDSRGWIVACVGYESDRLNRLLEEDDGAFIQQGTIVFGIPPYRISWEMHALLPHLGLMADSPEYEIVFAGANNPRAVYLEVKSAYAAAVAYDNSTLIVAPFGSKPSGIGAALFCCLRDDVRVAYDFPVRLQGRTVGVGVTYRYLVAS